MVDQNRPRPSQGQSPASETRQKHEQNLRKDVGDLIEETVSDTYSDFIDILSAKIEIAKIEVSEQLADIIANMVLLIILLCGVLYLSASGAIFIGDITGYPWLGYLIISSVIFIIVFVLTKVKPDWLRTKIQDFILSNQATYSNRLFEKQNSEKT